MKLEKIRLLGPGDMLEILKQSWSVIDNGSKTIYLERVTSVREQLSLLHNSPILTKAKRLKFIPCYES